MARHRRKTRTHVKVSEEDVANTPKSMVVSLGDALTNHSVTQLVHDVRNMMQPHTAIKLKERKSNKLRDFVVMAGPLSVTHMMVFTQSESGSVNLRLSRIPRGPTVSFKVKNYSLCKDVKRILKHPKSSGKDYLEPPLLVLNGFHNPANADYHEKVVITLLQSMFPPLNPQTVKVSSIKRVLILNKNEDGEIDLRHYSIDTKPVEISKSVKKLVTVNHNAHKKIPNLGKVNDVSDFVLDPYSAGAFTSDSEIEDDEVVQISDKNPHLQKKAVKEADERPETRKKAIKLTEIGPRIKLELIKIEEGVSEGKVLYHSYINKTQAEINKLEQRHAVRRKLKEKRRKEQAENVDAKKEKKTAKKLAKLQRKDSNGSDSDEESSSEENVESEDEAMPPHNNEDDELFSE